MSARGGLTRPSRQGIGAACAAVVGSLAILLLWAPAAGATVTYLPEKSFPASGSTPESFSQLLSESVGFNETTGHIYVADSGRGQVYDFASASDTAPAVWSGTNTPSGSFGEGDVAVAVYSATGDVYVADKTHAVIDKFDSSGNLIASFGDTENGITHTPEPNGQLAGLDTPAGSFSPASHPISVLGIAVDQATGDLYAIDAGHKVIDVFSPSGAYLRQITATPEGLYTGGGEYTSGIAVNSTSGLVYIASWGGPGKAKVYQFDSSGTYLSTWDGETLPNGSASEVPGGTFGCGTCALISVATEDSTGHVIIGGYSTLNVFDSTGDFIPPQLTLSQAASTGLALQQSTGDVFLSFAGDVVIYRQLTLADATVQAPSGVTARAAVLNAHVDPAGGGDITHCVFEYVSDSEFGLHSGTQAGPWSTALQRQCDADSPPALPYSSPTDVSVQIGGLAPGSGYHVRVRVENSNGPNISAESRFETIGSYGFVSDVGSPGSGDGQLEGPEDVALNISSGDLYVADTGNSRVVEFDANGDFVATWGWGVGGGAGFEVCTNSCQAGLEGTGRGEFEAPAFVEVDNSSGPSNGDVYVGDTGRGDVQKFGSSGGLLEGWGEGGSIDFNGDGPIEGITVDNSGSLFVGSTLIPPVSTEPHWTEIGPDGVFRKKISTSVFTKYGFTGEADGHGIDIGSFGTFYQASTGGGVNIAPGGDSIESSEPVTVGNPTGLAVDRPTGDLYVSHGRFIYQFPTSDGCFSGSPNGSPNCNPADTFGGGELSGAMGLAFDFSSGMLYAADSGADDIAIFAPRPAPTLTTGPSAPTGPGAATVSGHIDAFQAADISECYFEYGAGPSSDLGSTVPCEQSTPISAPADVTAKLVGLQPFTSYRYRLVVVPGDGVGLPSNGRELTFTVNPSSPPSVDATSSTGVGQTSATVTASINPNLGSTTYVVQYGTNPSYGSNTLPGESIGEDSVDHTVSTDLTGLSPGTAYHYRVVAVNFSGTTTGPDQTFTTAGGSTTKEPVTPPVLLPIGPESVPNPSCSGLANRALADSRQATALRGQAKHASSARKARALRQQAARLAKQARRLGSHAKRCEGTSGRGSQ